MKPLSAKLLCLPYSGLQRPQISTSTSSLPTQRKTRSWRSCRNGNWDLKHTTTEAQVESRKELMAKDDFRSMFVLVLVTTYDELAGLDANFAKDESLEN